MNSRSLSLAFFATLLTFLAVDAVWLGVLMTDTYQSFIGELMLAEPNWTPAVLFYLLYPAGLMVFAVVPAVRKQDWRTAALLGGLLGLVAYGTYDLSNMATLRGWPWQMTVVDMAWGTFLSCISASAGYAAGRK